MPTYTHLAGFGDGAADQKTFTEQLQENLVEFFNWGLLEAGGYSDILVSNVGVPDPTDDCNLLPNHMPGVADGRIWQAPYRNWVWESGLESSRQPVAISGVYVNGTFSPTPSSGTANEHYINYPEGRVVFTSPIATNSVVQAEYSYRWVNFYDQSVPWFRDVIFDAFRYETTPDVHPSGIIGLLNENAVQLPAVVVETVATRKFLPKQLGDRSQWIFQDFLFHVVCDNAADRSAILDIVTLQKDKTIYLFDANARAAADKYPLDWHGSPVDGAMTYPVLVSDPPTGFRYKKCFFSNMVGQETSVRLPLFRAIIRVTLEVEFTELQGG